LSRWSHNPLKLEHYQYPLPICVLLMRLLLHFNSKQNFGAVSKNKQTNKGRKGNKLKSNFAKNNLQVQRDALAILVNCAFRSDLAQPLQNAFIA